MESGNYRGIAFRFESAIADEFSNSLSFHVDTTVHLNLTFVATPRYSSASADFLASFASGNALFDEQVHLATKTPAAAAAYLAIPEHRDALISLIVLGFNEVVFGNGSVSANWPLQSLRAPPMERLLSEGVPALGILAGRSGTDMQDGDEKILRKLANQLDPYAAPKSPVLVGILALLPPLPPLAYAYVGGFTWFLVTLPLFLAIATLVALGPQQWRSSLVTAFAVAICWKAVKACNMRNRLIVEEATLSASEFNSFRFGAFALVDLVVGCVMALTVVCWNILTPWKTQPGDPLLTARVTMDIAGCIGLVWVVQHMAVHSLGRVLRAFSIGESAFLDALSLTNAPREGTGRKTELWKGLRTAVLLTFAVSVLSQCSPGH